MSRKSKQRPIYPRQILEIGVSLIGNCLIGGVPQRIAAAKRLDVILASNGLRISSLFGPGVPGAVVSELERLACPSPAPDFKSQPKLVPGNRGRKRWATAEAELFSGRASS